MAFVHVQGRLLNVAAISDIDCTALETMGEISVRMFNGETVVAKDAEAVDAVMRIHPAVIEGCRMEYTKHAWSMHNVVGHPMMQALAWIGQARLGMWFHDATIPRPRGVKSPHG